MNSIALLGRLTKNPEVKATASGTSVVSFTLAVQKDYKNEEGTYGADFINCVAYKQTADFIGNYFHKGSQMGLTGRINTRTYEDKDGKNVYVTEVIANNVYFAGTKVEENKIENKEETSDDVVYDFSQDIDDDELPF